MAVQEVLKKHILFRTALMCCKETEDNYCYTTNLYPIYLIVSKFIDTYNLDFMDVVFKK